MYKKAPQGMVAQGFTITDPTIPTGILVCLTGDMTIGTTGGPCIGELVAKDIFTMRGTVELHHAKILNVTAGTGGLVHGNRASISAEVTTPGEATDSDIPVADAQPDLMTSTGVVTMIADVAGQFLVLQGGVAGANCVVTPY